MLYVFLVNSGTTLTFDMQLAMQTVDVLKKKIGEFCRIPPDKQVLLISGGEWLEVAARVGSYSAGTDTSPIFLFSKMPDSPYLPTDSMQNSDEIDDQVAGSLSLPPSYSTVVSRSQLAQQIFELGKEQVRQCDQLIHEQHLQQQGWAAVVANMDDLSSILDASGSRFTQQYTEYLQEREGYFSLLDAFPEDLQLLARIPMLEELDVAAGGTRVPPGSSLLDWISAQDTSQLEEVCDKVQQGLELMDEPFLAEITDEQRKILDPAMVSDMSEIRGLEDRLMRLDELRHHAQITVSEQKELAKAFIQNQARASCVNDASVLPDLCASHCTQLQVMLEKHRQLVDSRKRCAKAKEELSGNLQTRLSWVVSMQRRITELSSKLMIYSERLKQLRQHTSVLKALHQAPVIYLQAVCEVVRRRQFTSQFLAWAGRISGGASAVHSSETVSRKRFMETISGHFVRTMFPGVEKVPPPFAVACPDDYDARLPPLTTDHVSKLRDAVPELQDHLQLLASHLPLPESGGDAGPSPLTARLPETRDAVKRLGKEVTEDVAEFGKELAMGGAKLLELVMAVAKEENNKVAEFERQVESYREQIAALETRLESNLRLAADEHDKTVQSLTLEHTVELERAQERTTRLEHELEEQRAAASRLRAELEVGTDRERIVGILEASFQERERKLVEACAERMRAEHETEKRNIREQHAEQLQRQSEEQRAKLVLEWREVGEKQRREQEERHHRQLQELADQQERRCAQLMADAAAEQQAALAAVAEQLKAEHRAEVQALRSRFRMMTSNLGSPSDGSSENLPLGSPQSDGAGLSSVMGATRQREERRRLISERDFVLDQVRAARKDLSEAEPAVFIQRAADRLTDCEQRLLQLESSSGGVESDGSAAAEASVRRLQRDNDHLRMQLSRSTSGLLERGQVSILTCNDGDVVLLVWDEERRHFRVFQEAVLLYFVHADSVQALGLCIPPSSGTTPTSRRQYAVAEVVSHEFCQAKKEGNRYRVARGTRFYRVRVKPWTRPPAAEPVSARRLSFRSSSVESHDTAPSVS